MFRLVLDSIVREHQNSFIRGRQNYDNVIIAHEIMPTLKKKTIDKYGYMILEFDMSKAFDQVE